MLTARAMKFLSTDFAVRVGTEEDPTPELAIMIHLDNQADRADDLITIALNRDDAESLRDQLDALLGPLAAA